MDPDFLAHLQPFAADFHGPLYSSMAESIERACKFLQSPEQ
jgi:hypothetical protein